MAGEFTEFHEAVAELKRTLWRAAPYRWVVRLYDWLDSKLQREKR